MTISNVTCTISFMPHVEEMRDYSGYFYASDPVFHDESFLTKVSVGRGPQIDDSLTTMKVWYAGAYTVQTNTVPLNTGRQVPFVQSPG